MRPDTHLSPGCPWYELSELRLPNVDWCEAQRCSWVVEPANAWSNLAYVAVGLALWWLARNTGSRSLRLFGPAAAIVGICSGIYHASYTFVLQILDFFGMYVFCFLVLGLNLTRLGWLASDRLLLRLAQLVAVTTALTVGLDFAGVPIQGIVLLLILAVAGSELWLQRRPGAPRLSFFLLSMALFGAGAVFSVLDVTRTWCDPAAAILQGHAIWHVLSAVGLLAAYLHYRQLASVLD